MSTNPAIKEESKTKELEQEEDQSTTKKVFHRKKHKNSRLGCPQCKQRRIKCDEALPSCQKCLSRSIRCGYLDYSSRDLELILLSHWEAEGSDPAKMPYLPPSPQYQYQSHHNFNVLDPSYNLPLQNVYQVPSYNFPIQHQQPLYPVSVHPHPQFVQSQYYGQQYFNTSPVLVQNNPSVLPPSGPEQITNNLKYKNTKDVINADITQSIDSTSLSDTINRGLEIAQEAGPNTYYEADENSSLHPIDQLSLKYSSSAQNTPDMENLSAISSTPSPMVKTSSINTPTSNHLKETTKKIVTDDLTVKYVPHFLNKPQYDLKKAYEFLDETATSVFARVFLFEQVFFKFLLSWKRSIVFKGLLLQGVGPLLSTFPELSSFFLNTRGIVMNYVLKHLSNVNDLNAELLLTLVTVLNTSSIYLKDMSCKEFFSLASGPGVVLRSAFENPSKFPKSFIKLKYQADGLLFTAKYVWTPQYSHESIYEFLDTVKEFGLKYIENEDFTNDDDVMVQQYSSLIEFTEFCIDLFENYKSSNEVLRYPIKKIYELVQRWYSIFPSECATLGTNSLPIDKTFYVFWFALTQILSAVLVGGRYIFAYFLDGYYLMYGYKLEEMLSGIEDKDLIAYINYSTRVCAYFNRRKAYIIRNTILNNPFPKFFDENDRFKARSLDIHEHVITSFRNTLIKKWHYPIQSYTSNNILSEEGNYYKFINDEDIENELGKHDDTTGSLLEEFDDILGGNNDIKLNIDDDLAGSKLESKASGEKLDFVNGININTGLLYQDFDPRFTDPTFNERIFFQSASVDFLDKYIEDRKLIIQMDAEEDDDLSE